MDILDQLHLETEDELKDQDHQWQPDDHFTQTLITNFDEELEDIKQGPLIHKQKEIEAQFWGFLTKNDEGEEHKLFH